MALNLVGYGLFDLKNGACGPNLVATGFVAQALQ